MINITEISSQVVREHEKYTEANVTLGSYDMDKACPLQEIKLYQVTLEKSDAERIYLLNEQTFIAFAKGNNFKLTDIHGVAEESKRVRSFLGHEGRPAVDLRNTQLLAPILVASSITGALTIIDGNHRLSAQYLSNIDLSGVSAYLYVHPNMDQWEFISQNAKDYQIIDSTKTSK
jgi:hypothetical protein